MAENDQDCLLGETCENYDGYYRDHFFDFADAHKKHQCRRDDITTGLTALRGITGVRQYFKVNESKILAELRAGNKPKGFESEACNEDNSLTIYYLAETFNSLYKKKTNFPYFLNCMLTLKIALLTCDTEKRNINKNVHKYRYSSTKNFLHVKTL